MMFARKFRTLTLVVLSMGGAYSVRAELTAEDIGQNVLLGEIYPSGRIYLRAFEGNYPYRVLVRGLATGNSLAGQFQYGTSSHMLQDSSYIPGFESMDDAHNTCGAIGNFERNSSYGYLNTDFFLTSFDYCETNQNVAVYDSQYREPRSFPVIGFGTALSPERVEMVDGDQRRPLNLQENSEIAELKKAHKDDSSKLDCTTEASFLDEAVQVALVTLSGTPHKLRLSKYEDPGCYGKIETVYVLDVLDNQTQVKRFELRQYRGPR